MSRQKGNWCIHEAIAGYGACSDGRIRPTQRKITRSGRCNTNDGAAISDIILSWEQAQGTGKRDGTGIGVGQGDTQGNTILLRSSRFARKCKYENSC